VTKRTAEPVDLINTGLNALAAGSWLEARASFEAAIRARETPEALEGLSWAAWWLDDAPSVFEARGRAYLLYRRRSDPASAARMAIWLAIDHLDFHGALAVAAGWLRRATRLLGPLPPRPEHGWLSFQEGYLAHLRGDATTACERARAAAEMGRRFNVPDLEMLGLALEGSALVSSAEVADGMRCLDEATAAALEGEATVPISSAWALCFLVTACLNVRDYRRAFEWSDRIAEFARRYRSRYMFGFCRSHYGAIHISQGRWADAEAELLAAIDEYARSRPAFSADPLVWLAELRRRQGRSEEAAALLDRAGDELAGHLCRGRLALDHGDAVEAVELAERCLRQLSEDRKLERAPALELLVRATVERGEPGAAVAAASELQALHDLVRTPPLAAGAARALGLVAGGRGDHESARRLLEDAADTFGRAGAVFEALTTRIDLAVILVALGRFAVAKREASRASDGLEALGARLEAARARRVLDQCDIAAAGLVGPATITPRERDVLRLLAEGMTNREIAQRLVVSEHTVHRHVTNLLRKLDLPSRAAAAAHAVRTGLAPRAGA
jgi:DNA-binding CsgD family transcriptional regulator